MGANFPWRYVQQDLSAGDLILPGRSKRSYEILDVYITGHTGLDVPTLTVNDRLMLGMPSNTNAEQLFPNREISVNHRALLSMLRKKYPDVPTIKSTPGDDVVITDTAGSGIVTVIYRQIEDQGLFDGKEPGAPDNAMRLFISHGRYSVNIAVGTENVIAAESQNPPGLTAFPFGEVVPANRTMELLGFSTLAGAAIGANTTYVGIRLWHQEEAFLVEDEAFLNPLQLPYMPANADHPITLMDKTRTFTQNERLRVEMQFTNAGAGAELAQAYFTALFIQRPAKP